MKNVEAVNSRIRSGQPVTQGEVIDAVLADVTAADLTSLAASLTASTGQKHNVYLGARGLAVYPASYEQAFADAGAPLQIAEAI
jgi:hypothetical protein